MGEKDRIFNSAATTMQRLADRLWQPACDIYRTTDGWVVKFDLAGVEPDDLTVSIRGCNLLVRGSRRDKTLRQGVSHYHMEITYSRFERVVALPCDLTNAEVRTDYSNGLLLVTFLTGAPRSGVEGEGTKVKE